MSIVVRYPSVDTTMEKYDEIDARLRATGSWPPSGLDHHLCFGSDRDVRVSEVWDSREQWEAWGEVLMPVLAEEGIRLSGEPDVFEVHNAERR